MPNISWSKGKQTLKFGQGIEYNNRNIFFKNHAENEAGRLVMCLFLSWHFGGAEEMAWLER